MTPNMYVYYGTIEISVRNCVAYPQEQTLTDMFLMVCCQFTVFVGSIMPMICFREKIGQYSPSSFEGSYLQVERNVALCVDLIFRLK